MSHVNLSRNNAERGGAIYNEGALDIIESTLSDNLAWKGEAIYNAGSGRRNLDGLAIINSNRTDKLEGKPQFMSKEVKDIGGVVYNEGTIILKDAILVGNGAVAPPTGWGGDEQVK